MNAIYLLDSVYFPKIYGTPERADIGSRVTLALPPLTAETFRDHAAALKEVEAIFSGWGMPLMDEEFLQLFPNLKVVFYGAGSIRSIVTPAFWQRGIAITSAYGANAVPVAEFTLSQVLFSLKQGWQLALSIKRDGKHPANGWRETAAGSYEATVGLLSLGMIGRLVAQMLARFDLRVIAYDPYVSPAAAAESGVELCPLEEVFRQSSVVSCHIPLLPETQRMLKKEHFLQMPRDATFLNTARGGVVDESGLIAVLRERPDLFAVLDVTDPEPPSADSPFRTLPNVILTPHLAGSVGSECRRMGRTMIEELDRYLAGEPLRHGITEERSASLA